MSTYIGVDGTARDVDKIFIGVDGVAREVERVFIGVDGIAQQCYPELTLENATWEEISALSKSGIASLYFSVGETKTITFNGTTQYVQIIGFEHDSVSDSATYGNDKAGITFQFGVCNDQKKDGVYSQYYRMDTIDENSNAWQASDMRYNTMKTLKGYMPQDLQNVIVTVNKYTGAGSGSTYGTYITDDDLFLLSECEITGEAKYAVAAEGEQYEYYSYGTIVGRYLDGKYVNHWLRSPMAGDTHFTCYYDSYNGRIDTTSPTDQLYVSFAFCV